MRSDQIRHCEEPWKGDEAIQHRAHEPLDCFAWLAMTEGGGNERSARRLDLITSRAIAVDARLLVQGCFGSKRCDAGERAPSPRWGEGRGEGE